MKISNSDFHRCLHRLVVYVVLSLLSANAAFAAKIPKAVVWVKIGDTSDAKMIADGNETVKRLNAGSAIYQYYFVPVSRFGDVELDVDQLGLGITHENIVIACHGAFDSGYNVYIGKLLDVDSGSGSSMLESTLRAQYPDRLYHCGMDGNNGLIGWDDVAMKIKDLDFGTYQKQNLEVFDHGTPTNIIKIDNTAYDNFTIVIPEGRNMTLIGGYNLVLVKPGASLNISGPNNKVTETSNNFLAIWSGSKNTQVFNHVSGNIVNLGKSENTWIYGYGGNVGVCDVGAIINGDGYQNIFTIEDVNFTLNTEGNALSLNSRCSVALTRRKNSVYFAGTGATASDLAASDNYGIRNTYLNCTTSNTVNLGANTFASIEGGGGSVGICDSGVYATCVGQNVLTNPNVTFTLLSGTNNNSITLGFGAKGSLDGTGNSMQFGGSNSVSIISNMGLNIRNSVTNFYQGSFLKLGGTTDTTINEGNYSNDGTIDAYSDVAQQMAIRTSRRILNLNYAGGASSGSALVDIYGSDNRAFATPLTGLAFKVQLHGSGNYLNGYAFGPETGSNVSASHSGSQSGGCTHIYKVTEMWYYISTGVVFSTRVYYVADPLVFDFSSENVLTTTLANSSVTYDIAHDGRIRRTAWGRPGNGYLMIKDPDGSAGGMRLLSGYEELRALAGYGNKLITKRDPIWASLAVWIDREGSGVFRTNDCFSLDDMQIASLGLCTEVVGKVDNGNHVFEYSDAVFSDGHKVRLYGVGLSFE